MFSIFPIAKIESVQRRGTDGFWRKIREKIIEKKKSYGYVKGLKRLVQYDLNHLFGAVAGLKTE